MSNEYNYDSDSAFFPYFVLTITGLITLPLTYTLLRAPSDQSGSKKGHQITSSYTPDNADIIETQRAKQKRKELRLKRMLMAGGGWLIMAYMVYLIATSTHTVEGAPWDPWSVLGISMSATEKQINSRYRLLSRTMHPDKRQPNPELNQTIESINDEYMNIVKAHKTLTDEDVRNNWIQFGHPDGRQSTSFGIALPQFLVAEGSGKYVLVFYGALLGVGLPWLVGKWWYGMQQRTKEKVYVTSAGNMFKEYSERMDSGDTAAAVSTSNEFRDILEAHADTGLGKLEGKLQAADDLAVGMLPKDRKKLDEIEDPVRRKTLALIWAYLGRLNLDDKTLEAEKYELAPTTLRMNEAFLTIALAYGFTAPVLSTFHLSQDLVQAVPPSAARLPLLQLPHFTPNVIRSIEHSTGKKEHLSIQSFMVLPAEQRRALATAAGLTSEKLSTAETVARQLPLLKVEKAFFKVQGEKHITPSSLVQFVLKARFIPPGSSNVPAIAEKDLLDPDPADGDLAAQKQEPEQHPIPLAYAPYLPRDRAPRWHIFLADNRQAKIAVPPFTFGLFDKKAFDEEGKPTFEVVTLKMQFQAPPQAGEYRFQCHGICDSYIGFDWKQEAVMRVEDASKALEVDSDDDISEPEEDTIAGQMAALKGQPTADPDHPKQPRRKREVKPTEDDSDYESGTDEDEESESETDTDTDSDDE